jgi:hypothetical protein
MRALHKLVVEGFVWDSATTKPGCAIGRELLYSACRLRGLESKGLVSSCSRLAFIANLYAARSKAAQANANLSATDSHVMDVVQMYLCKLHNGMNAHVCDVCSTTASTNGGNMDCQHHVQCNNVTNPISNTCLQVSWSTSWRSKVYGDV